MFRLMLIGTLLTCLLGCTTDRERRIESNRKLFESFSPEIQEEVNLGRIDIGYTEDMVLVSLGQPNRAYRRKTAAGLIDIWVYTDTTILRNHDFVTVPVRVTNRHGKRYAGHETLWVDIDTLYEYTAISVEFEQGIVTAFEWLQ